MAQARTFGPNVLDLPDPVATIDAIAEGTLRDVRAFRRRGAVVALSGGVDSSVVAALAARAFGPDHVLGVLMPERDSSSDTMALARLAAESCGIGTVVEDITAILEAAGCYRRRDEAIRQVIPEFGDGWRAKLVLPSVLESERYRIFSVVVRGARRSADDRSACPQTRTCRWWRPPISSNAPGRWSSTTMPTA